MRDAGSERESEKERAVLVGVSRQGHGPERARQSLEELRSLAEAAGAVVVGEMLQQRERPDASYLLGKGKARELRDRCEELTADMVIFDQELTPSQQRNLEELCGRKVIDRTALILDIFALHAHTSEGKNQVELAQLRYLLTRLSGRGSELSRLGGGIGTRGPGETKLEADRRRIRRRIEHLQRELEKLEKVRAVRRKRRSKMEVLSFALVGYTNAGKSTLLNRMTKSCVPVEDKPFSTLDPTTRRIRLEDGTQAVLTDTVGFIEGLPHHLIEAFKSTLEEVAGSDAVIHVIDATSQDLERRIVSVLRVLEEIGAGHIPRLDVLNKIDRCDGARKRELERLSPGSLQVSAITGEGLQELKSALTARAALLRDTSMERRGVGATAR
jgi:GTP-binding protein HflX